MQEFWNQLEELKNAIAQLEADLQRHKDSDDRVVRVFLKAGIADIGKQANILQFINCDRLP